MEWRAGHVRDHRHEHGWVRGVLCNPCNGTRAHR
ncbi:endonuclease domain-containing protein [Actinomadura verrucosospora]